MVAISRTGRRRRTTVGERSTWVDAWERSGQTQVDFARAHGLRIGTLRRWTRTKERPDRPASGGVALTEVDLAAILGRDLPAGAREWEAEIRLPNGVTVAVGPHTPASRVREGVGPGIQEFNPQTILEAIRARHLVTRPRPVTCSPRSAGSRRVAVEDRRRTLSFTPPQVRADLLAAGGHGVGVDS